MKMVDDFRWKLRQKEYVPIMTGGMGVDISTAALALESARLGGIGHISDAMVPTVSDRRYEDQLRATKVSEVQGEHLQCKQVSGSFRSENGGRSSFSACRQNDECETRRWDDFRQLHGKALNE